MRPAEWPGRAGGRELFPEEGTRRKRPGPWLRHGPGRLCLGVAGWLGGLGASDAAALGRAGSQDFLAAAFADTTEMHVGDRVTVRLSVAHPSGWSVQWPDSFDLGAFEALRFEADPPAPDPGSEGGRMRSEARLVVTSFELGELDIPSLPLVVAGPDGVLDTLGTDPFRIGVVSVGLDETGAIRDIKGPLSVPRSWWGAALFGLAAAVAGAAVALLARRRRRRPPGPVPGKPGPPPRPHHLVALEALAELEASPLLEQGRVKEFHVRASDIVRTYLEGKLEVPALELTTGEVAAEMRRAALDAGLCEQVREFLEACDLVKFAKLRPSAGDSLDALAKARAIVEATSGAAAASCASVQPPAKARAIVEATSGRMESGDGDGDGDGGADVDETELGESGRGARREGASR